MRLLREDELRQHPLPPCVATVGCFDGVHRGHRFLVKQVMDVAERGNLCSAVVTFGQHPKQVLCSDCSLELLTTREERFRLLEGTGADFCVVLDFTPELAALSARRFMKEILRECLNVRTLVIGYDHRFGHGRIECFEDYCRYGAEIGMEVLRAEPFVMDGRNVNSSSIRLLLREGNVMMAASLLGYCYFLEGKVVEGYRMGRELGFPTANIEVPCQEKLVPADGVYAVQVSVGSKDYAGMLDIGNRPTFADNGHRTLEVHIFDFSSDIYGQRIRVAFVERIRSNIKFESKDDLVAQLCADAKQARAMLAAGKR